MLFNLSTCVIKSVVVLEVGEWRWLKTVCLDILGGGICPVDFYMLIMMCYKNLIYSDDSSAQFFPPYLCLNTKLLTVKFHFFHP